MTSVMHVVAVLASAHGRAFLTLFLGVRAFSLCFLIACTSHETHVCLCVL